MEVIVNRCFGGFGLSYEAVMLYAKKKGMMLYAFEQVGYGINDPFKAYVPRDKPPFVLHYSTQPLTEGGQYVEGSYFLEGDIARNDPALIEVVKELGIKADGDCARLEVVEIPDGIKWKISEYEGLETVEEAHRSW